MRTIVAMSLAVQADPAEALQAAGVAATPEAIAAVMEELKTPPPPAPESAPEAAALADEIERVNRLRGISAKDKLRMIRTLVDLYEQTSGVAM